MWLVDSIKKRLARKCKRCYFYQNNACVMYKRTYLPCEMRAQKIQGVDSIEFYVNLVNSKRQSIRALYFSIASLLVSFLALFVNYLRYLE